MACTGRVNNGTLDLELRTCLSFYLAFNYYFSYPWLPNDDNDDNESGVTWSG